MVEARTTILENSHFLISARRIFAFASELFNLDPTSVGAYLRHAFVERVKVTANELSRRTYWDLASIAKARQVEMAGKL